jgi:hypothetical protein
VNDQIPNAPDYWNGSLPDHGPLYTETDMSRFIREPWNAATAFAFVLLAVVWLFRMRGKYRQHPFLLTCLPILLAGGIGGTIYHAFRRWPLMLALDVVPILLLVVIGSIYLCIRLWPRHWPLVIACFPVAFLPFIGRLVFHVERHVAILIHYMLLSLIILLPVSVTLVRTRFRHAHLVWLTLVCFGFGLLFRYLDPLSRPVLPMGSHWLWHLCGAGATAILAEYFYRLETEPIAPLTETATSKA